MLISIVAHVPVIIAFPLIANRKSSRIVDGSALAEQAPALGFDGLSRQAIASASQTAICSGWAKLREARLANRRLTDCTSLL